MSQLRRFALLLLPLLFAALPAVFSTPAAAQQTANIAVGDTKACLQGKTVSGDAFEGCDSIRTVPSLSTDSPVLDYVWLSPAGPDPVDSGRFQA